MRNVLAALLLLVSGVTSIAADLPKAPVPAPVATVLNWSGFYIGVTGGANFTSLNWNAPLSGGIERRFSSEAPIFGVAAGYNYQLGQLLVGIEGDLNWTNNRGDFGCVVGSCAYRNDWFGTARSRAGLVYSDTWLYLTGGLALENLKINSILGDDDRTRFGWTVGGGVERNISGAWTGKIEYLYSGFRAIDCATVCGPFGSLNVHSQVVRLGLNYRFEPPPERPVPPPK